MHLCTYRCIRSFVCEEERYAFLFVYAHASLCLSARVIDGECVCRIKSFEQEICNQDRKCVCSYLRECVCGLREHYIVISLLVCLTLKLELQSRSRSQPLGDLHLRAGLGGYSTRCFFDGSHDDGLAA